MNNCITCHWWKTKTSVRGICERVDVSDEPIHFEIDVKVADDHNLEVCLVTGPNFGCVLHKEVTDESPNR